MRLARVTMLLAGWFWIATAAGAAALPGESWLLECLADEGRIEGDERPLAVLRLTAEQAGMVDALVRWRTPTGETSMISLRPVEPGVWASRVDLGETTGEHELTVLLVDQSAPIGTLHARSRQYRLWTPSLALSAESEIAELTTAAEAPLAMPMPTLADLTPMRPTPEPPAQANGGGWGLAVILIILFNLVLAFTAGLAVAIRRRWGVSHRHELELDRLAGLRQILEQGGLIDHSGAASPFDPEREDGPNDTGLEKTVLVELATPTPDLEQLAETSAIKALERLEDDATQADPLADVEPRRAPTDDAHETLDLKDLSF